MEKYKVLKLKGKEGFIYDEVNKIYQSDKKITAEKILNLAKNKKHPLHSYFEWDNEIAGNKFRLIQARELIKNIILTIKNENTNQLFKTRAFVNINISEDGDLLLNGNQFTDNFFLNLNEIKNDNSLIEYQLLKAKAELKSFKVKYSILKDYLGDVFKEIDKL